MIGNTEIVLIILVSVGVLFFRNMLLAKELAVDAAKSLCNKSGVQFLDGTAVLQSLRPARTVSGRACFYRKYSFDFSEDGMNRKHGEVVLLGHSIRHASLWPTLET